MSDRFAFLDTRKFRLGYSAFGLLLWLSVCVTAFNGWKFVSGVLFGLTVSWIVSVYVVMAFRDLFKRDRR